MIAEKICSIIQKRISTDDEWYYGIEKCWKEEIEILTKNIDDTILFLENECTSDEFSWLSEVFDDVAEQSQSKEFVDCLHHVANKYPEECKKYHIYRIIQSAEDSLVEN